jgi:hypothetical protein
MAVATPVYATILKQKPRPNGRLMLTASRGESKKEEEQDAICKKTPPEWASSQQTACARDRVRETCGNA